MGIKVTRRARASWQGTVPDGGGRIALGSGAYEGDFTLKGRTEDNVPQTNPEELIGAAHAGCFTMSLANLLEERGHPAQDLQTTAKVLLEQLDQGFTISRITLETTGSVDGVDEAEFQQLATEAKETCPVSRALAGTQIEMTARLAAAGGAR
jgi:osmotically inducible protein OsmC